MEGKCLACGTVCITNPSFGTDSAFYTCPVCGRYQLSMRYIINANINRLASYLCYHRIEERAYEYRYHTILDKESCDKYRDEFNKGNNIKGLPVHMDEDIIDAWYPKTFAERVDKILLYLNSRIKHIGQQISMSYQESLSVFFIDRGELVESLQSSHWESRNPDDCAHELKYMLDYLTKCSYIEYTDVTSEEKSVYISLAPEGYARVDMLQKDTSHGRNVFVAMRFGEETKSLRESIRKGIQNAEYNPEFIDEVQHNNFITPEILKHIRDSKFVVVDLTHKNNGAYLEEGYAMGLGKPVIQLCKQGIELHFDIAQINTILWQTEEEIPDKLCNRIKATIE